MAASRRCERRRCYRPRVLRPWLAPILAIALASSTLAPAPSARADDAEACLSGLDEATLERLATQAESELAVARQRARVWTFTWLAVNLAFLAGSVAYATTQDSPLQRDAGIWSAAGSAATAGLLFAPPLATAFADRRLAHDLRRQTDPRARLAHVLALLELGASQERACRAPFVHVANGVFSLSEGLYLGLRYENALSTALANGIGTFVISETQLVSSPRRAGRALERLRRAGYTCAPGATRARPEVRIAALGVRVDF